MWEKTTIIYSKLQHTAQNHERWSIQFHKIGHLHKAILPSRGLICAHNLSINKPFFFTVSPAQADKESTFFSAARQKRKTLAWDYKTTHWISKDFVVLNSSHVHGFMEVFSKTYWPWHRLSFHSFHKPFIFPWVLPSLTIHREKGRILVHIGTFFLKSGIHLKATKSLLLTCPKLRNKKHWTLLGM